MSVKNSDSVEKFGKLEVTSKYNKKFTYKTGKSKHRTMVTAKCDCGSPEREYRYDYLTSGRTKHCGCERKNKLKFEKGDVHGRLTLLEEDYDNPKPGTWVKASCSCGSGIQSYLLSKVLRGDKKSCGCLTKKHGNSKHELYQTWASMKYRCLNPNYDDYHNYGGRGIRVCQRWLDSFENFLEDMGKRPDGCTLDRIDNDGDYSPYNCRWATIEQQNQNKRVNVLNEELAAYILGYWAKWQDEKYMSMGQLAKHLGISYPSMKLLIDGYTWKNVEPNQLA